MKHLNKKWLLEKEYLSLKREDYAIPFSFERTTRESEIESRLLHKFYNKEWSMGCSKKWRKYLNQTQRAKSKQTLIKQLKGYQIEFVDNYKDASWWYW